jgi:ABC-2 type transport system ATP-binding protein
MESGIATLPVDGIEDRRDRGAATAGRGRWQSGCRGRGRDVSRNRPDAARLSTFFAPEWSARRVGYAARMERVLEVTELRRSFGTQVAVDGVSFTVGRGEIVGLLGPNGAGKTTTINMVLGVLEADGGSIKIVGIDAATRRGAALERTNFAAGYAPLPGNLTVAENLRIFALLYGVPRARERIDALIVEYDLARFRNTRCGVLSSGEQMRACLAKAMLNDPRLLLLDEPTASLDPAKAAEIRTRIRAFAGRGEAGVLWTSHNMVEVAEVCDRVLFLSHGRVLLEGDPRKLPGQHGKATLEELFLAVAREPLSLAAE